MLSLTMRRIHGRGWLVDCRWLVHGVLLLLLLLLLALLGVDEAAQALQQLRAAGAQPLHGARGPPRAAAT
jgi:hypothetical protein